MGVWNTEGEPVDRELLLRMNERMAHRGPDGASHLLCGPAGFAFQQMKVTPESVRERQPLQSPKGTVVLWDGRLDNREELIPQLQAHGPVDANSPDVDLVMAAYDVFQDEFASKLDGDFAAAVYDPLRRQLLLVRDAIGVRALNYCRFGPYVLFASEIKALLVHPAVKTSPDLDSLAEFLYRHWDYSDETNTFFTGISTVPPARVVVMTPASTTLRRHFDFDTSKTLRLRSQTEYVQAYREAFFRAVKNRLRSTYPTAITVSGGLDSSSIFCTADYLKKQGSAVSPLLGIGMVGTDRLGNETEFQESVEAKCGTPLIKQSVSALPSMRNYREKTWHAEGLLIITDAWQDLYEEANQRGARTLLSGFFGDHLLVSAPFILDLILQGKWLTAYRSYQGYCGTNWFPVEEFQLTKSEMRKDLFSNLKGYLVPERLRPAYHRLRKARAAQSTRLPFFSEEFHQVFEAYESKARTVRLPPARAHRKALYHSAISKKYKGALERDIKAIGMFGMEIAYPFFDRNLISLVMSMPGEKVYPEGASRGIHREAMKGILPENLRNRRSKGDFTRLARLGALQDFDHLEQRLARGAAKRFGLLKPEEPLRADLAALKVALQDESDANALASWKTVDLLELEEFLAVFFAEADRT
ncbi:MAG: asparagine synthase-related protein [Terriglobales bacterium]